jgi:hypothetical protein
MGREALRGAIGDIVLTTGIGVPTAELQSAGLADALQIVLVAGARLGRVHTIVEHRRSARSE